MDLFNSSCAPTIDQGVLSRLGTLDDKLFLTFSYFAIDPSTSYPVEVNPSADWADDHEALNGLTRRGNAYFLMDPAYHLWTKTPDGAPVLVESYPIPHGGFGHREVARLERDVARRMKPSEITNLIWRKQQALKDAHDTAQRQYRTDVLEANKSRIVDLMENQKVGFRQAKIASYPGQVNRSTPGDIRMDDKEDGWEKLTPEE